MKCRSDVSPVAAVLIIGRRLRAVELDKTWVREDANRNYADGGSAGRF